MPALRKCAPEPGVAIRDVPVPAAPAADEVLVAVEACGVCGTDLHIADWDTSYHHMAGALPVTLGHEMAGIVRGVGEAVPEGALGRRVVVRPSVTCGTCEGCRTHGEDGCTNRRGIGIGRDGGFAPLLRAPWRNCLPVSGDLPPALAALTEPVSVAAQAVARAGPVAGRRVLVLGPGFIGLAVALVAQARGAHVLLAGRGDAPRLAQAAQAGVAAVLDTAEIALADGVAARLDAPHVDIVIEAAGSAAAVQSALPLLRPGGILVVVGIHGAPVPVDLAALVRGQIDLRGSYRAPVALWPDVLAFLDAHRDAFARVSRTFPFAEILDAFARAQARSVLKPVIVFPGSADASR